MKIGYIGLGKMGKNMVLRLLEQGIEIVAWNRSKEPLEEVFNHGAQKAENLNELVEKIGEPGKRVIWVMMTAGDVTEEYLLQLSELLVEGDLIIDGGNSFYKDTLERASKLAEKGIHLMDVGTSGGPIGARNGACLMIGGDEEDFKRIEDLFKAAADNGNAYKFLGKVGAGHFAKMVHNGIEYGMMEAIAEGLAVLGESEFDFNLKDVFEVYNKKSVIESRLVGWTLEALEEDPKLENYSPKIGSTGEGEWTIKTAEELGVEVPVIKESFRVRVNSQVIEKDSIRNRAVSAMRGKFGGHSVKKD